MSKRIFDFSAAFCGVIVLSPVLLLIAIMIKACDGGAIFFRQERVGRYSRLFRIWKFRSMVDRPNDGPSITRSGDQRVTKVGLWLRRAKLDELPQLFNVLAGEMSLVGPRPEVPKYVALYTEEQRRVLSMTPGITDLASLEFRDEEALLGAVEEPERFYIENCIPRKIELNLKYAAHANLWTDILLIAKTLLAIGTRGHANTRPCREPKGS